MDARALSPALLGSARETLRDVEPYVLCLTDADVQPITADALLVVGAEPATADDPQEAGEVAAEADAVLVGLGTVDEGTAQAVRDAVAAALYDAKPWVLDLGTSGDARRRTEFAAELVVSTPDVVCGSATAVLALAGADADSTAGPDDARAAAVDLAGRIGSVVAVSGPVDLLTDGQWVVRVGGGGPVSTLSTGAGSVLGALTAAYLAATGSPLASAVAAHAHVAVAGPPGTSPAPWLDALGAVDGTAIGTAQLTVEPA